MHIHVVLVRPSRHSSPLQIITLSQGGGSRNSIVARERDEHYHTNERTDGQINVLLHKIATSSSTSVWPLCLSACMIDVLVNTTRSGAPPAV